MSERYDLRSQGASTHLYGLEGVDYEKHKRGEEKNDQGVKLYNHGVDTSRGGGWVYAKPLSYYESKVKDEHHFPWVSTSFFPNPRDLPFHGHHSQNTHIVIRGSMEIFATPDFQPGSSRGIRDDRGNGGLMTMAAGESYCARMPEGCDFVEGHRCLSPTTRDRFLDRKQIKWRPTGSHAQTGSVSREVQEQGDVTAGR